MSTQDRHRARLTSASRNQAFEDEAGSDIRALRQVLLPHILENVPFDGWTHSAMEAGAEAAGVEVQALQSCYPGGISEVIADFSDWTTERMVEAAEGERLEDLRMHARIIRLVRLRLEVVSAHREAVRTAMVAMAAPANGMLAPRLLWEAADAIWNAAGDTSEGVAHHSRRILLSGVISSTVLYWLADDTPDHEDTWSFLERRINDIMAFGRKVGQAKKLGGGGHAAFRLVKGAGKVVSAFVSRA